MTSTNTDLEGGLQPARGLSPAQSRNRVQWISGHDAKVRTYRRRLPHCDAPGVPTFVTWRLYGSLPQERVFLPEHLKSGKAFLAWDRFLDRAQIGPLYLRKPEIAALVEEQLQGLAAAGLCSLHAYVVMPNHVHLLWTPQISLARLIRSVKGPTARRANQLLRRSGQPFWQEEYFDRIVKSEWEESQIRRYIEWNPVKATLVAHPEEFQWSSSYQGGQRGSSPARAEARPPHGFEIVR